MQISELQPVELDFWSARALGIDVRIGQSSSGIVPVCWQVEKERQMWSPSTRWRQSSRVITHMCQHGTVKLDQTGQIAVVDFTVKRGGIIETFRAVDAERLTIALVRCFLMWRYGKEVPHV